MMTQAREQQLTWIFRVALAMCFIGHGMFGVLTKQEWIPFFGVVGLSPDAALTLMPIIGTLDIILGVLVLFAPVRAALLYMAVWALWTASLRPLSGDSILELLERAGNYGVPLAFLLLLGPARTLKDWITRANTPALTPERQALMWRVLSVTTVLLLVGHGGLALGEKGILVRHAGVLGLGAGWVVFVGAVELVLALAVLLAPRPALLIGVVLWKIGTELLYPIAGAPVWEFIERGGSYAAPLILAVLAKRRVSTRSVRVTPRMAGLSSVAAAMILSAVAPASLNAQKADNVPVAPAGILDSLRRGGYVILCRHAATNHDQSDRGATRELQRNLSSEGEQQAKNISAVIRALRIPIGEVRASPMYRNRETAAYAFGDAIVDSTLAGSALRAKLIAPVPRGTNRAIVVRQGTIYDSMGDHGIHTTSEGDCFVVQPVDAKNFRVLARLRVQDWGTASSR
jgi:hypothetical protein